MVTQHKQSDIKTAKTVFGIVETLNERGEANLTEIADHLGMAKSTVYDHLMTMVKEEYLVKEDKDYRLSLKFLEFGISSKRNIELSKIAQPALNQMANETNEIAWLMVEEYGQGVYLNKAKGNLAVQAYGKRGTRVLLHQIASGKAILAHLPDEYVLEIIDRYGLPAQTENTITDSDELFDELETIRERGVAFNDSESMDNFRAVASPIVTEGELHGSIVVSAPKNRLRGDRFRETVPEIVSGTANALELELMSK